MSSIQLVAFLVSLPLPSGTLSTLLGELFYIKKILNDIFIDLVFFFFLKSSILNELLEIVLSLVDGLVDPILGVLNPYRDPCKQVGLASLFLSLGVTI